MVDKTDRGTGYPWFRDFAFVAAVVGGAWVIANAIGELKAEVIRNAVLIERNAQAIGELKESVASLERRYGELNESLVRLEGWYGELNESLAQLSGQYAEHIREHGLAAR